MNVTGALLRVQKICVLGAIVMMPIVCSAFNCDERTGRIVKDNNGIEYCLSLNAMNWWTALGWCQSIGGTLVEYPSDCQCVNDECPRSSCPAFHGIGANYIWTKTPSLDDGAYSIALSNGMVCYSNNPGCGHAAKRTYSLGHALCK